MTWLDIAGWTGTVLIVLAYAFVSNGIVGVDFTFQAMNLAGAALLGINVLRKRAWASVALQLVWIAISATALAKMV